MTIYELEQQATPGPFACDKDTAGSPVLRSAGSSRIIVRMIEAPRKGDVERDANGFLFAHCRNHFMKALEALKAEHQKVKEMDGCEGRECATCDTIAELEEVEADAPCQSCGGTGFITLNPNLNPSTHPGEVSAKCPWCNGEKPA